MCHKVIIMEIKEEYTLAMGEDGQILRIKNKEGMHVGDRIYVLDEDLYHKEEEEHPGIPVIVPFHANNRTRKNKPHFYKQMAAVVAAAAMFLAVFNWNMRSATNYAMVTIDGEKNLELTINKKHVVKDAVSKDGSLSEAETKKLVGQQIEAVEGCFTKEKKSEKTAVVGYAMWQDATKKEEEELHRKLEEIFGIHGVVYINGSKEDMEAAKKAKKSLGIYLTEQAIHEDDLDRILNSLSEKELWNLLKKQPHIMDEQKNRDAIEKELEEHEAEEEAREAEKEAEEKAKEKAKEKAEQEAEEVKEESKEEPKADKPKEEEQEAEDQEKPEEKPSKEPEKQEDSGDNDAEEAEAEES